MKDQRVYFPNLNGLRFIAAFLVIIHHIEQFRKIFGLSSYWEKIPFFDIIGKLGVVMFFVLSGFLITYLLVVEDRKYGEVSIWKFYMRRILRIWPLYFFILFLAFAVFPNIDFFVLPGLPPSSIYSNFAIKLILYVVFLPNLVLSFFGVVPYMSQAWSVGTEEQFYLIWPLLTRYFKKHRIVLLVAIILLYAAIDKWLFTTYSDFIPYKDVLRAFWSTFNIDCMAIGGLFAIILFERRSILNYLLNKFLFYLVTVLLIVLLIKGVVIPKIHFQFYALLFAILILNLAENDRLAKVLENKVLNYLGAISYGLYMYHPIGITAAIGIGGYIGLRSNFFIYPATFAITIVLAGISYKYFESFFLQFKEKFAKIKSGAV